MQNRTIYVPMPTWQARIAIEDKIKALLGKPDRGLLPGEFVMDADGVIGFDQREDAIAALRTVFPTGRFAIVHIVFGNDLAERLAWTGDLRGSTSGPTRWSATEKGRAALEVEAIFLMEVVPFLKPEPEEAPARGFQLGAGPTGFGGC